MPDPTPTRTSELIPPLRSHPARLSLGNSSPAVSTSDHLRFQLDHALARDAVHTPLDLRPLLEGLRVRNLPALTLHSAAPDRKTYLRRPDLGRTLSNDSTTQLQDAVILSEDPHFCGPQPKDHDSISPAATANNLSHNQPGSKHIATNIAIILADGLSSLALERHALPLLDALLAPGTWNLEPEPWALSPVCLVTNARVAIGDPIGELLHADMTVTLIGERPGLSSPDSLGCYLTWNPHPGRTDAERNCISNIRGDAGLSYAEAALRIVHYIREAHRLQTTGTTLKDPTNSLLGTPGI